MGRRQNRNTAVVTALIFLDNWFKIIHGIWPLSDGSGPHTCNNWESEMHDWIIPTDLANIFRMARFVSLSDCDETMDFKSLKYTKRDIKGCQIQWLKAKLFHFDKDKSDIAFFKQDVTDKEFRLMTQGRPSSGVEPKQSYAAKLKISASKSKIWWPCIPLVSSLRNVCLILSICLQKRESWSYSSQRYRGWQHWQSYELKFNWLLFPHMHL